MNPYHIAHQQVHFMQLTIVGAGLIIAAILANFFWGRYQIKQHRKAELEQIPDMISLCRFIYNISNDKDCAQAREMIDQFDQKFSVESTTIDELREWVSQKEFELIPVYKFAKRFADLQTIDPHFQN